MQVASWLSHSKNCALNKSNRRYHIIMFPATACPEVCAKSGNAHSGTLMALLCASLPLLLCCFTVICDRIYLYQTTGQHDVSCL